MRKDWRKMRKGFTLMEVIFVVIIIAMIASFTIPKILSNSDKTQIASVLGSDVKSLYQAASEWKRSSTDSDGTWSNLDNAKLEAYLPANMSYDSTNNYIVSSGFSGSIHYKVLSDKISNDGDSFKVLIDMSKAKDNSKWNDNVVKYAETKANNLIAKIANNTNSVVKSKDAKDIGNANDDFTTGGTDTDAISGVRQIAF